MDDRPRSRPRDLGRLLGAGMLAACFGSVVGTVGLIIESVVDRSSAAGPANLADVAVIAPFIVFISLFGTVPGALLIGCPALYFLRYRIAARPLLWAVPVVVLAMALSWGLLGWSLRGGLNPNWGLDILLIYSGACGLGFVVVLARWRAPALSETGSTDPSER